MSVLQFFPQIPFPLPPQCTLSYSCNVQHLLPPCNKKYIHSKTKPAKFVLCSSQQRQQVEEHNEEEEEFQLLTSIRSSYNNIKLYAVDKKGCTYSGILFHACYCCTVADNVHSILNKGSKWTGSYWDEFATLPPVVPRGPIAIFGLGGGTAAHLMLELWPSLQLEGWEIDEILIDKARDYLGLSDLEKQNMAGGVLNVHVGDVLSSSVAIPGGYAGIIVDLFSDGKVLPQLQEAATWLELNNRLMPNGRFMVNCGAGEDGLSEISDAVSQNEDSSMDGTWELNATIKALCKALPGQCLIEESRGAMICCTGSYTSLEKEINADIIGPIMIYFHCYWTLFILSLLNLIIYVYYLLLLLGL